MREILFIHGMWSRPRTFDALRGELAAAGIRSHAPALPHHDIPLGAPPPAGLAEATLADYVAALEAEVARLGHVPVIAGHSMGGLLAQLLSVRVRPPGLILLAPAPSAATPAVGLAPARTVWSIARRWGWWRRPTLLDEAGARWGVFNGVPEADVQAALPALTWDSGRVLAQISFPQLDPARGARVDFARLTMPALVMCGTADRITPAAVARATARKLAAAGARVDHQELPHAPHWLFHDAARGRVEEAIGRFLASL